MRDDALPATAPADTRHGFMPMPSRLRLPVNTQSNASVGIEMAGSTTEQARTRPRFTLLIPTFNRWRLVLRALDSIAAQTYTDFEIVVVDDGSTDVTVAAIEQWSVRTGQALVLVRQAHLGTHAAYNAGVAAARGEWVMVLGSDDQLIPEALPLIAAAWDAIPPGDRTHYCGVAGLGLHWHDRQLAGNPYPSDVWDATYLQLALAWRLGGDKPAAYRRDLLLQHPFPVFDGEPFMHESYVLKRLALTHKTRHINAALQYFEYQPDGLSANIRRLRLQSPRGMSLYSREDANHYTAGFGLKHRYYAHVRFVRHALGAGERFVDLWRQIRHKHWLLAALPFGTVKWLRDGCQRFWSDVRRQSRIVPPSHPAKAPTRS